ncbi:MAG TPA: flagellar biosynthesis protein FlgA [Chloroflexi bacterium]|nr:flagellar biosynthesis protein FlgA [Chloroflexota bacterium]
MLYPELEEREKAGQPIRVGVVGTGQMGEGLVCQMELMKGMKAFAVADIVPGRAVAALREAKLPDDLIVETDDADLAAQAVREGKRVATTDASIIARIPDLDIVVEATGIPEVGARVAMDAILANKHMVQMNVETDATVGYILRRMANSAGIVYTLTAGDEPGATMELYDFAHSLGFEVICAGKGKNNPLDRTATPDSVAEKAAAQQMNPKMLASFVDGTKTMVEMTSLGNAIGFVPDVRGMHGPQVTPGEMAKVFVPESAGGILKQTGVVEYGLGIAPGVFVIFTTDHPKIIRDLRYLKLGDGPYWALYRPYHLTSLETPISIARAVLKHETTIATDRPPVAETITIAKRDLKAGETIDALGGYTVYGMIERADVAREERLLPLGLAPGSKLLRDVAMGEAVTYDDVELNESLAIVHLRRLQDQMLANGSA